MKNHPNLISSLTLASCLAILSVPAVADRNDCGMGAFQMESSPQHEKRVHNALNLTTQQEGAWQKYLQSLRQQPSGGQSGKRADWATLSAPERAEQVLEASKKNQEHMAQQVSGMKTFYATLSPEQQKTFDKLHGGQQSDQH